MYPYRDDEDQEDKDNNSDDDDASAIWKDSSSSLKVSLRRDRDEIQLFYPVPY